MLPIQQLQPHSPTRNARVMTEPPKLQKRPRMLVQFEGMPPLDLMAPVDQNQALVAQAAAPAPAPAPELAQLADQVARLRI